MVLFWSKSYLVLTDYLTKVMTLQNIVETHMEHNALYVSRDPHISKPPSYILHHVSAYCKRAIRLREDTPPTEDVSRDGVPCNQDSGGPSVKINLIQSMLAQESPTGNVNINHLVVGAYRHDFIPVVVNSFDYADFLA